MSKMTKVEYRATLADRGVKTTARMPLAELRRLYAESETAARKTAEAAQKATVAKVAKKAVEQQAVNPEDLVVRVSRLWTRVYLGETRVAKVSNVPGETAKDRAATVQRDARIRADLRDAVLAALAGATEAVEAA